MIELPLKRLICISETKLKGITEVNISFPGYVFNHENSSTNAIGVGIHISSDLYFEKISYATLPDSESS